MTAMDPGPVSREEAVEAAQAILTAHHDGGRCWRCLPDGSCPARSEAAVRLADERDRLLAEGRRGHPLFDWGPGGVRQALRTGGAVLVIRDSPPRVLAPEEPV